MGGLRIALSSSPFALLAAVLVMLAAVLSPDAANQACGYGEGTSEGETVYTTAGTTGSTGSSGEATGTAAAGLEGLRGMWEADAMAWFGGLEGPGNVCHPYAYGQCTWWSCMREHKLGHRTGSYWGNGMDWGASAGAAGWKTNTNSPVVGSIVSFPPGSYGADPTYGHVAVVEKVDRASGIVTISEKSGGVAVSLRTLPIDSQGAFTYANPPDMDSAKTDDGKTDTSDKGDGDATAGTRVPVTVTVDGGKASVNVAASERPSQCSAPGSPFTYHAAAVSDGKDLPEADDSIDGTHATPDQARSIARAMLPKSIPEAKGDDEFACLDTLWEHESGWMWNAYNPFSGATGIPQSLPGDKMGMFGDDWKDNAATQIAWGLYYIRERYGTPCQAWAFWQNPNIYVPGASGNWY